MTHRNEAANQPRRLSVAHLLAALVAMFVVLPLADDMAYGALVEAVLFTLVLLAAVSAVGGRHRTYVAAVILAAPAVLARWGHHFWPAQVPQDFSLLAAIVFVAFVIGHLLHFALRAPVVTGEVLCAAISSYLLLAVAWSFAYVILAVRDPAAFTFTVPADAAAGMVRFTALYYSFQILTTITFGDILPVSRVARMMSLMEAGVGVFYLAIMIARLVSLYSSRPQNSLPDR